MLIMCWSVKGGSGTTVTAAAIALLASQRSNDTALVDLAGDIPAVLGLPEPAGRGVADWLSGPASNGPRAVTELSVPAGERLSVIPTGARRPDRDARWSALAAALTAEPGMVVVDAGTGEAPPAMRAASAHDVLVVRGCYLALRRAAALSRPPSGIVLVCEPGRALRRADVEQVIGAPVVAELDWDPAVARAVDAGLLATRLPSSLRRGLEAAPWTR